MNNQLPITESDEIIRKLLNISRKRRKKLTDVTIDHILSNSVKVVLVHKKVFKTTLVAAKKTKIKENQSPVNSKIYRKLVYPKIRSKLI